MKTVILEVRAPDESMANFVQSWKTGKPERAVRIAFATPELLCKSGSDTNSHCSG